LGEHFSFDKWWGFFLFVSFFFFNVEYLFYSFVLCGRRGVGLAGAKPCPLLFFLFVSFIFINIEYQYYLLSCADGA